MRRAWMGKRDGLGTRVQAQAPKCDKKLEASAGGEGGRQKRRRRPVGWRPAQALCTAPSLVWMQKGKRGVLTGTAGALVPKADQGGGRGGAARGGESQVV